MGYPPFKNAQDIDPEQYQPSEMAQQLASQRSSVQPSLHQRNSEKMNSIKAAMTKTKAEQAKQKDMRITEDIMNNLEATPDVVFTGANSKNSLIVPPSVVSIGGKFPPRVFIEKLKPETIEWLLLQPENSVQRKLYENMVKPSPSTSVPNSPQP